MSRRFTAGVQRGTGDSIREKALASVSHVGLEQATRGSVLGHLLAAPTFPQQISSPLLGFHFFLKIATNKQMRKEMH